MGALSHYFQSFLSNDHTDNPAAYSFNGSTYPEFPIWTSDSQSIYLVLLSSTAIFRQSRPLSELAGFQGHPTC
jgi:hypothetical protein